MPVICPERASLNFIPSSYGTPSLALGSTGVCVVNSDCVVPVEGAETVNVAVALVSPVAEAVTVAVPVVVAVKLVIATPF